MFDKLLPKKLIRHLDTKSCLKGKHNWRYYSVRSDVKQYNMRMCKHCCASQIQKNGSDNKWVGINEASQALSDTDFAAAKVI